MPIAICSHCHFPVPDSYHDFTEICSCKSKEGWIDDAKKRKFMIRIDGEVYDFTLDTLEENE